MNFRRILLCICTMFLMFETLIILEQQRYIASVIPSGYTSCVIGITGQTERTTAIQTMLTKAHVYHVLATLSINQIFVLSEDVKIANTYALKLQEELRNENNTTIIIAIPSLIPRYRTNSLRNTFSFESADYVARMSKLHKDNWGTSTPSATIHLITQWMGYSTVPNVTNNVITLPKDERGRVLKRIYTQRAQHINNEKNDPVQVSKLAIKQYIPKFQTDERANRRLSRLEKLCKNPVAGNVDKVFINPQKTVSYCVAYKVASTHWLRVFRYLWNDTVGNVSSPSKITKMDAHFSPRESMKQYSFNEDEDIRVINQTVRFMFVREPYSRLWSVYIDKFVLADYYFWSHIGPKIAMVNNLTELSPVKRCYELTFKHFINYVIAASDSVENMDGHIRPVHSLCNPCIYKPDFVGKVETMKHDNNQVLKVLNVEWGDQDTTPSDTIYDEMNLIIDFNFRMMRSLKWCLNPISIEIRILRAFVLNGYISEDAEMKLKANLPMSKEKLLTEIWKSCKGTNQSSIRDKRLRYKEEAYLSIPLQSMHELQKIYHMDFKLFDYRPDPPNLFYNKRLS